MEVCFFFKGIYKPAYCISTRTTMQRSIELYNKLHECCREAMTISEANAEGCNFYDNEATNKAFEDFRKDYSNFCDEQNTVEGEPFTQDPPSIAHYLAMHKATKKANRKLKIGVTAPPVMDFPMRAFKEEKAPPPPPPSPPVQKVAAMTLLQPVTDKKEIKQERNQERKPSIKKEALQTGDALNFEAFVKVNPLFTSEDMLIFLPRSYQQEMSESPIEFVKRHAFPNRQKVMTKIKNWKEYMKAGKVKKAADMTIRSLDGRDRLIGSIAFSFKSFDRYYKSAEKEQFVALICDFIK